MATQTATQAVQWQAQAEAILAGLKDAPVLRLADRSDGWLRYVLTWDHHDMDDDGARRLRDLYSDAVMIEARDGMHDGDDVTRMLVAIEPAEPAERIEEKLAGLVSAG